MIIKQSNYMSYQDPRVPWYAKLLVIFVVGYTFSPIDLIPDFIPVLGYVDDLILSPLGIQLIMRLIPEEVLNQYQAKPQQNSTLSRKTGIPQSSS